MSDFANDDHDRVGDEIDPSPADTTSEPAASAFPSSSSPPRISVELNGVEARVLGSLIEKSFLTPDVYPMTTNGLVTACNQKTNRDPVVSFSAVDIDGALMEMRQRNLVRRVHTPGSRSTKHRQTLDEALSINEKQLVLMSVLLLRGPQTIGELRLRTERHDVGFEDLDAVESCLEGLASRVDPLVVQLARQPGHKEARWQHMIGDPDLDGPAAEMSAAHSAGAPAPAAVPQAPASASASDLGARVDALEAQVATLTGQLASLAAKLGEPLE